MMKRCFDFLASLLGLIAFSPLLLWAAWRIKRFDGGSAFYKAPRTGLHGNIFYMYKFRSMVMNADKIGGSSTSNTDSRMTPIGAFLRRYKIDELPQLINVFKGEMSLVGPRPEVKKYTDMYQGEELEILTVRPGITDWASLWNCDEGLVLANSKDPDKAYEELIRPTKLKLQIRYVRENNLVVDIKIIIATILRIFKPNWMPTELEAYPRLNERSH